MNDKKYIIILFFLCFLSFSYSQQILWSTIVNDSISIDDKFVPLKYVDKEVLKFFDHYDMHYDLSGYSKKRFVEEIDLGFDNFDWINEINEITVFALRTNLGNGSVVLVMCISRENVNSIIFSNNVINQDYNYIHNMNYERDKFKEWFNTLLD